MTLAGTRPILQDELLKYELHHRARIAIKPGITGMWQVSGRSDITDFEEVVRLDTEYISKDDLLEGKSALLEWSFAVSCDVNKNPAGDEYLVFYVMHVAPSESVVVCPVDPYVEDGYFEALKELSEQADKSDVLKFLLEDNCSLVVRPSGTEPKLKIYISVSAENKEMAEEVEDEIAKTAEKWIC